MKYILLFVGLFIISSCSKTNEQKQEYIYKNLAETNEHVKYGAWYAKKYGKMIVPEILEKYNNE